MTSTMGPDSAARRARFRQVILGSLATHLPDNIDFRFEPWGRVPLVPSLLDDD